MAFLFVGITGPRGRTGRPGINGTPGIPGINAWKVKVNGTFSNELLIPPSIAGKFQWIIRKYKTNCLIVPRVPLTLYLMKPVSDLRKCSNKNTPRKAQKNTPKEQAPKTTTPKTIKILADFRKNKTFHLVVQFLSLPIKKHNSLAVIAPEKCETTFPPISAPLLKTKFIEIDWDLSFLRFRFLWV